MPRHPRPTLEQDLYALLDHCNRLWARAEAQGKDDIAWELLSITQEVRRVATGNPYPASHNMSRQLNLTYPKGASSQHGSPPQRS